MPYPTPKHMSNTTMKYEPQRTNHFEVLITNIEGAVELNLAVSEFSLPNITNSPIEIGHGNSKVKFAGQTEFGGSDSLTVIDFLNPDVELIVTKWHKTVYNPDNNTIGWASSYKKEATVTEYAPDGSTPRVWTLEGVWPSGVAYGDGFNYDGSDVKKITITLSYDKGYRKK